MGERVDDMLETMSSAQLSEYQMYNKIEGFGDDRLTFMMAQITSLMMNLKGGKTKPVEFIPTVKVPEKVSIMDKIRKVFSGSRCN